MSHPLPDRNEQYLEMGYWNTRFDSEQHYDWFKGFNEFKHLCIGHLQCTDSICILGCGNSTLTQDLYNSGYQNLTSVDLSEVVIDRMRKNAAAASQHKIKWQVADMLDLPYPDSSFNAVIEKGTMDVLFVDNDDPFSPKAEVRQRVFQMLDETHRVLKADGAFLSITFAQPHFRKPFLLSEQYTWDVNAWPFGDSFHYYVYAMHKNQRKETDKPVPFGWPSRPSSTVPSGFTDSSMQHDHMDNEDFLLGMEV
ncbi:hypothetical protein ABBQ32_003872 [Trebouxia sp. C0010 RCD-2024]